MPTPTTSSIYLCVHVSSFTLQAVARHSSLYPHAHIAILDGVAPFTMVIAMTEAGAKKGLYRGMSYLEASRIHNVRFFDRSPTCEALLKKWLLDTYLCFTPAIEDRCSQDSCTFVLDITASVHFFGSIQAISDAITSQLTIDNVICRAVASSNFDTALLLATHSRRSTSTQLLIVHEGKEAQHLLNLPIECLPASSNHSSALQSWGISTFKDLARCNPDSLISRLGKSGKTYLEIAQGTHFHLFSPIILDPILHGEQFFDTPIASLDALLLCISSLLLDVITQASSSLLAISSLSLSFGTSRNHHITRLITPAHPSVDTQLLLTLIRLDLLAHPISDCILALSISAETGHSHTGQWGLFNPQLPDIKQLDVTMKRIVSIVGDNHAGAPVLKDSYNVDSFYMATLSVSEPVISAHSTMPSSLSLRRLRPALPAQVTLCNKQLLSFFINTSPYNILMSYGPWEYDHAWWDSSCHRSTDWDLAALDIHTDHFMYCRLSHDYNHGWQLVGIYD